MTKETSYEFDEPLTPELAVDGETRAKRIKKLLIVIAPIVILAITGGYFFFFVIKAPKLQDVEIVAQNKEKVVLGQNIYLDMDPITVGLTPSGAKREYLRLTLTLKVGSDKENTVLMNLIPVIKDALITFLRSLRATDFNSSSSAIYVKEEITKRINKIAAPIVIKEVLFQEITVN